MYTIGWYRLKALQLKQLNDELKSCCLINNYTILHVLNSYWCRQLPWCLFLRTARLVTDRSFQTSVSPCHFLWKKPWEMYREKDWIMSTSKRHPSRCLLFNMVLVITFVLKRRNNAFYNKANRAQPILRPLNSENVSSFMNLRASSSFVEIINLSAAILACNIGATNRNEIQLNDHF